jgi:hypothetical protein
MTGRFVASYTGHGMIRTLAGKIILLFVFLALFAAYLDDDMRQMLSKNQLRGSVTAFGLFFFFVFLSGILIDIVLGAITTRRGQPALIMDRDGFQGRIFYRWKSYRWDALGQVYSPEGVIGLKPRPHGFAKLLDSIPTRFGPVTAANAIYLRVGSIDKSSDEIVGVIRRFAPGAGGA